MDLCFRLAVCAPSLVWVTLARRVCGGVHGPVGFVKYTTMDVVSVATG